MRKKPTKLGLFVAGAAATAAAAMPALAAETTVPGANGTNLRVVGPQTELLPTVSISGSTAMRNFTVSQSFSLLDKANGAASAITLGPTGDTVTYTLGASTSLQFASNNTGVNDVTAGASQVHNSVRVEWHEQGSVEGILELVDSQITDFISNTAYNPTSGNGTFVNRLRWGGTSGGTSVSPDASGSSGGYSLGFQPAGTNFAGFNVPNAAGQNRIQMAISDVAAPQGFSVAGTGLVSRTPGQAGYGKGNPLLPNLGSVVDTPNIKNGRRVMTAQETLNMVAGATDPQSGGTYGSGAWNTGGTGNLRNDKIAITATTFSANPGTGLTKLNRTDAQFLQTTGRLGNGADFNSATRDVNSGTLNVASVNAGVDPSWAVGENDSGNGNLANGGTGQVIVGPNITFSNKTAGGAQLRPLVQRSRMAVGHLSLSDAIGSAGSNSAPVRILDYRDDVDDDGSNNNNGWGRFDEDGAGVVTEVAADPATGQFVRLNVTTLTNGQYALYQNQTYVTVRTPDANYAGDVTVKGDNSGADVRDLIDNVKNSASTVVVGNINSAATPAEGLINQRFIPDKLMKVGKSVDGIGTSDVKTFDNAQVTLFRSNATSLFNVNDPSGIKEGAGANYGAGIAGYTNPNDPNSAVIAPAGGNIAITSTNYLFGDFNQNGGEFDGVDGSKKKGVRDLSDLYAAQRYQAKLMQPVGATNHWNSGADLNNRSVTPDGIVGDPTLGTLSKGDLIAMGDYDSDGDFDGKDLKRFAIGAALVDQANTPNGSSTANLAASSLSPTTANNFGDQIRKGKLVKNAALDWLRDNATNQQKLDASVNSDPTWAFSKFDVNEDGVPNAYDLHVVRRLQGLSVGSLNDQLGITSANVLVDAATAPNTAGPQGTRIMSLVTAELNDDLSINATDLDLLKDNIAGDFNGDGSVDFGDIVNATQVYLNGDFTQVGTNFSGELDQLTLDLLGDFNDDDLSDFGDVVSFTNRVNSGFPPVLDQLTLEQRQAWASLMEVAVPEPGSLALLGVAGTGLLMGRARRRRHA